ncbi:sentrin-specific protease 8-like [Pomacea canaliculata]|uniref:sentrin-specific protease 8-like n=1 Tax=Pomacea canaliculata TaxID=400727 RepID=UPI000D73BF98|nr:sentrin-specific protease 8-like [Pomacea canaliculata]
MAEDDEIVLSFNESLLRKSDVDLLGGPCWINDNLIGFCFEYFEREQFNHSADRLALLCPSTVQFIKFAASEDLVLALEPLNLPTKEFVFLPVNDNSCTSRAGGSHWSLLVFVRSKEEFQHYDSGASNNSVVAKALMDRLQPFLQASKRRSKFVEMDCPRQRNGYDCGMYVICVAEHLCRQLCECYNVSLMDVITEASVQQKRQQILKMIFDMADQSHRFS